jgi:hypothetical protein
MHTAGISRIKTEGQHQMLGTPNLLQVIPLTRNTSRNAKCSASLFVMVCGLRNPTGQERKEPRDGTQSRGLPIFAQWPWKLPIERKFSSVVDGPDGESDGGRGAIRL